MRTKILVASVLAVAACGGTDFNKPALLNQPRILAVKAEPPQPTFGQSATLSTLLYQPPVDHLGDQCPTPGATTYAWQWCPMPMVPSQEQGTYVCPFPEADFQNLYAMLGLGTAPPYQLGQGETLTFSNPFPASLLYALCRGDIGSMLGGTPSGGGSDASTGKSVFSCDLPASDIANNGNTANASETHPIDFKITIAVTVTPACPSLLPPGYSPLMALYSMHLPTDDAIPGNQNPVMGGIFVTENWDQPDGGAPASPSDNGLVDGAVSTDDGGAPADDGGAPALDAGQGPADASASHDGPDGSVPLTEDPVVMVKRDKHVGLQLDIDIGQAEHLAVPSSIDYIAADQNHSAATRHYEHLDFSWYAEAGDFTGSGKGHTTGYLPTALPDDQDNPPSTTDLANFEFNTSNTWDLPKIEDYGYPTARIIVVVRDGRGGVGWTSKQVSLEGAP